MSEDFKARLATWVREATYGLPGSEVADMLEAALNGIRPVRPVVLRSGRQPVAVTAPTPGMKPKRRGRPARVQPEPAVEPEQSGVSDDASAV